MEAACLGDVCTEHRQARVRQLEAADEFVWDQGPTVIPLHEVAAHLEVLLPAELRPVRVRGQACAPGWDRRRSARARAPYPGSRAVDPHRNPNRDREPI